VKPSSDLAAIVAALVFELISDAGAVVARLRSIAGNDASLDFWPDIVPGTPRGYLRITSDIGGDDDATTVALGVPQLAAADPGGAATGPELSIGTNPAATSEVINLTTRQAITGRAVAQLNYAGLADNWRGQFIVDVTDEADSLQGLIDLLPTTLRLKAGGTTVDLDGSGLLVNGTAVAVKPSTLKTGSVTATTGATGLVTVTYPAAFPAAASYVGVAPFMAADTNEYTWHLNTNTTAGFSARFFKNGVVMNAVSITFLWTAIL